MAEEERGGDSKKKERGHKRRFYLHFVFFSFLLHSRLGMTVYFCWEWDREEKGDILCTIHGLLSLLAILRPWKVYKFCLHICLSYFIRRYRINDHDSLIAPSKLNSMQLNWNSLVFKPQILCDKILIFYGWYAPLICIHNAAFLCSYLRVKHGFNIF